MEAVAFAGESSGVVAGRRVLVLARIAFLCVLALLLLMFGGADALVVNAVGVLLYSLAAWTLLAVPIEAQLRPLVIAAVAICIVLGLWIATQGVQIEGNPLANRIWHDLAEQRGTLASSISTGWGDTRAAVIPIMLPFAVFVMALALWPTGAGAMMLLRLLGGLLAAFALLGLVLLTLSPDKVLFVRPSSYDGSLTATLLNRDSAAALLGCGAVLFLVRSIDLLRRPMHRQDRNRDFVRFLLVSGGFVLLLGALLLTQSKAGIAAAAVGLALSAGLAAGLPNSRRAPRRSDRWSLPKRIGTGVGVAMLTALCIGLLAARLLDHGAASGGDYAICEFHGLARMLADNWILGTGAGTFDLAAPAYGDPACGISQAGVSAHSGLLEGWTTLGLPFVAVTLVAAAILAIVLVRGLASRRKMRWVPIVGCGLLTVLIANETWGYSMQVPGVAALVAALLAPVCAVCLGESSGS